MNPNNSSSYAAAVSPGSCNNGGYRALFDESMSSRLQELLDIVHQTRIRLMDVHEKGCKPANSWYSSLLSLFHGM